jgi:error-prone DNA polymerase
MSETHAELDVMSNFSFLEGASHPEELVAAAAELGYESIAIADRCTLAGAVRAHVAARANGIGLCIGARLDLWTGAPPVQHTLDRAAEAHRIEVAAFATDRASYAGLCRALTEGRRHERGDADGVTSRTDWHLSLHAFLEHAAGLELLILPPHDLTLLSQSTFEVVRGIATRAPGRVSLAVLRAGEAEEQTRLRLCLSLAQACGIPAAATQGVRFHVPKRRPLHEVLTAIRLGTTVAAVGLASLPNAERHLRSPAVLHERWRDLPHALAHARAVADRCRGFSLAELRYAYPRECSGGESAPIRLRRLAEQGAQARYPQGVPAEVHEQLMRELALIDELQYAPYFLTVHDIVQDARQRGILCQGRGAAANSVVCYCLGVTAVDPSRIRLLFERFVSRERREPPDIDIDFEHERREEVIQGIYARYGRNRAALCAAVVCYRRRLALRETAKVLGFSADAITRLCNGLSHRSDDEDVRAIGFDPHTPSMQLLMKLSAELEGFPRHLMQHPGGFVITDDLLCESVPIRNASMDARSMIEWDKDDIDALGMMKVDVLGLGMLTCIRKALAMIGRPVRGAFGADTVQELALHEIPPDDPATHDMLCSADTVGVFQVESRAQMAMLPRLRPRNYYDLVIEVALVRPGPIQGDMVHPYLRRRAGLEQMQYPNDAVRQILERTLGVPLFQEQAMALAIVAAGFTPGEADELRRSIAAWKRSGPLLERFRQRLETGMLARGYSRSFAAQVFTQIQGFAGYGFPESHSASFAHLVYASAWLRRHHIAAFTAALLNSQPMGFYAPSQIVQDAQRHGVEIRPIDILASEWDCTLEGGVMRSTVGVPPQSWGVGGPALRLGLRMVRGLAAKDAQAILAARSEVRARASLEALQRASGVSAQALQLLARADALRGMGLSRQAALWQVQELGRMPPSLFSLAALDAPRITTDSEHSGTDTQLPNGLFAAQARDDLPAFTPAAEVAADYRQSGLSLKAHPLAFIRSALDRRGVTPCGAILDSSMLPDGTRMAVAGLVTMRQRPSTAKGIVFLTLEDESGSVNIIVRPAVWERHRVIGRMAHALVVHGALQRRGEVIHIIASELEAVALRWR